MKKYEAHKVTNIFPEMSSEEIKSLADDIKKNGLRNPIILHQDKILDGRNRLAACEFVGVKPRFEEWTGEGSPLDWVVSTNLHRRHLTTSQRAAIAVDLLPLLEEEAAARMSTVANLPHPPLNEDEKGKSRDKAAKAMNVSPRSVQTAKKVKLERPKAFEKIKAGKATLNKISEAMHVKKEARGGLAADLKKLQELKAKGDKPIEPKSKTKFDPIEKIETWWAEHRAKALEHPQITPDGLVKRICEMLRK